MEVLQRSSLAPRRSTLHCTTLEREARDAEKEPIGARREDEEGQRRAGAATTAQIESGVEIGGG
jgi:hypothetical protein